MFHVCSSKRGPLIYESSNASVLGVGSRGQLFVTEEGAMEMLRNWNRMHGQAA